MLSYCTANPMLICLTQKMYFPSSSWQICHFCYKRSTFFLIYLPLQSQRFEKTKFSKIGDFVLTLMLKIWSLFSDCYIPPPHALFCPYFFFFFLTFFVYFWWIAVGRTGTSKEKKGLHSYPDEISKMIMN